MMRSMCPKSLQVMRLQLQGQGTACGPLQGGGGGPYVPLGVVGWSDQD